MYAPFDRNLNSSPHSQTYSCPHQTSKQSKTSISPITRVRLVVSCDDSLVAAAATSLMLPAVYVLVLGGLRVACAWKVALEEVVALHAHAGRCLLVLC